MLEIIGWLGSLYLLVKGLEIIGNQSNRMPRFEGEGTRMTIPAIIAAVLAISGAIIFPIIFSAQADGVSGSTLSTTADGGVPTLTQTQVDCINNAGSDTNAVLACTSN